MLVPAFNEQAAVGDVVRSVRECMPGIPVLVVDDCSMDGTIAVAKAAGEVASGAVQPLPTTLGAIASGARPQPAAPPSSDLELLALARAALWRGGRLTPPAPLVAARARASVKWLTDHVSRRSLPIRRTV